MTLDKRKRKPPGSLKVIHFLQEVIHFLQEVKTKPFSTNTLIIDYGFPTIFYLKKYGKKERTYDIALGGKSGSRDRAGNRGGFD